MCGVAGVFHRDGRPVDREALARMAAAIIHRGPDGEGFFVEDGKPSVGLANRRLAVIDVAGGKQPMSTEDGAFTIVYNGEVFNAAELREELAAHGHRFRSHCDTEVVLRGYAQWGSQVLHRLNGMWAFAVWDRPQKRLFLARDRLGVKPVVYAERGGTLVFGSEIKSLLASGVIDRELDLTPLPHYLSSFVVPEPYSFFRGVRRLPAGHCLEADEKGVREARYWDCSFEEESDRGRKAYVEEIRGLVEDAVRRRLVSDVPLGVFLSAGIDSGLVATFTARARSAPLKTFTLGFEGSSRDERSGARRLAAALGADHHEDVVTARQAAAALPAVLTAHDEPSQSLLQGYFVSQLARREVTVALSGLGGDELFSSYPTHRVADMLARLDRIPGPLREATLSLAGALPWRRAQRLAALAGMPPDARVSRHLLHQTEAHTRESLLSPEVRAVVDLDGPAHHVEEHYSRARARHPLNRLLYVYVKTYLTDELLRTLDTMSMRHSLEARAPLLDYRLVERAMAIPAHHKMGWLGGKVVLRDVARDVLPSGTLTPGKRGFAIPLDAWLHKELTEPLRDILSEASTRRRSVFDPARVNELVHRYLDGEMRLVQPVMMLFAFELWARGVLDPAPQRSGAEATDVAGDPPHLSVIIVNWNTREILKNCLASVEKHLAHVRHEVLVVDNASSDGSAEMVASEFPRVRLIRNGENAGFARANNQAMKVARGAWFLLLNSDTLLVDDSVVQLFHQVRNAPEVGLAHCRLILGDGRLQHTTYRFPSLALALLEESGLYKLLSRERQARTLLAGYWDQTEERDVDWVAGAFMLLPRQVFEQTCGFSEAYFMYGEDMEWCYRIRQAGWRIRHYPQASIVHLDHSSSAIRWGERRVAICIERQLDIYRRQKGVVLGAAFNAVKITGAALRVAYFTLRSLLDRSQAAYYAEMKRYYLLSLRVHTSLALGLR